MSNQGHVAIGIAGTVAVGLIARRVILAQSSLGGRYFAVAAWIAAAGLLAAAVTAFGSPRRPYITGVLTGAVATIVAAGVVFRREYAAAWIPVAFAVAFGAGFIGAFLGIASRWMIRGQRPTGI
jgi:hypothetical protein